jgi:low affinity Fe/Cu permease
MSKKRNEHSIRRKFEHLSHLATHWTGSTVAVGLAVSVIIVWLLTGPIFHYSDTWQLVINTGTSVTTFLMVFLIQQTQNKESLAVQLKLNEIVAALQGASNRMVDVESLSEDELELLHKHYHKLAQIAKRDIDIGKSHSIEEAEDRHERKLESHPKHYRKKAGVKSEG